MKLTDPDLPRFSAVIPALVKDYERTRRHFHRLFSCLRVEKLVFVGPEPLARLVAEDKENGILGGPAEYLNEEELLPSGPVRQAFTAQLTDDCGVTENAWGWYYQQFIKMNYASLCEDDYYLCWDADTVPLGRISMFAPDKTPYLDVKTEYQEKYFTTIRRLFGFGKRIESSFVAEHMLFNRHLMLEMIREIEQTAFAGDRFYEKILYAVGTDNISQGFSEFETYGTWVGTRHPSAYKLRNWRSFRNASFFVDIADLTEKDIAWLKKDYVAATFEKYQETDENLSLLFHTKRYREKLTPAQFYQSVLESGALGNYEDDSVTVDGTNLPV